MVIGVVVGIFRFQRGEAVGVRKTRGWGRRDDSSRDKRVGSMREGRGCVERGKGVVKDCGMKGMGGSLAGCMRWAREGNTDSLNKTWVAPESARMGEGVIAHRRAGGEGSSLSESYGDSRADRKSVV